jgi:zinc D-Ala-D-Ala carboxypeptidase
VLRRIVVSVSMVLAALAASVTTVGPAAATSSGDVSVAAPCPYSGLHPSIAPGDDGPPVAHLQCLLNKVWGYTDVAADGEFGPITERAVIRHQEDCGIRVDGVVGPETWRHLHPDTTTDNCRD